MQIVTCGTLSVYTTHCVIQGEMTPLTFGNEATKIMQSPHFQAVHTNLRSGGDFNHYFIFTRTQENDPIWLIFN